MFEAYIGPWLTFPLIFIIIWSSEREWFIHKRKKNKIMVCSGGKNETTSTAQYHSICKKWFSPAIVGVACNAGRAGKCLGNVKCSAHVRFGWLTVFIKVGNTVLLFLLLFKDTIPWIVVQSCRENTKQTLLFLVFGSSPSLERVTEKCCHMIASIEWNPGYHSRRFQCRFWQTMPAVTTYVCSNFGDIWCVYSHTAQLGSSV